MAAFLGIELRFRIDTRVVPWGHTVASVLAWAPELSPTHIDRLSDAESDGPERWSDALWPELARRIASSPGTVWGLTSERGRRSMTWVRRRAQVECSIAVPREKGSPTTELVSLLTMLEAGVRPALAMAFDDATDAALMLQGLHALDAIPPLLFLDHTSLARIFGARARGAPCETMELPSGLLLLVRPDPFARPSKEDEVRTREVARWLGIKKTAPLRLAP
jgi:hypothetical protein